MSVDQLSVFDQPMVRTADPVTCVEPSPERLSHGRWIALKALVCLGPMTDFGLAEATGLAQTSIGCRRKDLVRMKPQLARSTGRKLPSPTGSPSLVWEASPEGVAFFHAHRDEMESPP
jgi:hypothetical protein